MSLIHIFFVGFFPTKYMQTGPPLSFAPILMEDAQYAELNEKLI